MVMKKFLNKSEDIMTECLRGLELAHSDLLSIEGNQMVVSKKLADADRVTVVSLGGGGHEPALEGFVGEGMADIVVVGDVFAAPNAKAVVEACKLADKGKGVILVVFNHAGDMLTAKKTLKECSKLGLDVRQVTCQDDINTAPRDQADDRRGLVGGIAMFKIAGSAAAAGKSIDEVQAITQKFSEQIGTLAVGLKGATHPSNGEVLTSLPDDEMEIGMGQHGEGGGVRYPFMTADETTVKMADMIIEDLDLKAGEKVLVLINGSGSTSLMELLIIFQKTYDYLDSKGIAVAASWVDNILSVQETAGFQMLLGRIDDEMLAIWNAPCVTPYRVIS